LKLLNKLPIERLRLPTFVLHNRREQLRYINKNSNLSTSELTKGPMNFPYLFVNICLRTGSSSKSATNKFIFVNYYDMNPSKKEV
jgi:hypothetical protein